MFDFAVVVVDHLLSLKYLMFNQSYIFKSTRDDSVTTT